MDFPIIILLLGFVKSVFMWVFGYPIIIQSIGQFETKKGFIFHIRLETQKRRMIVIQKNDVKLKIKHDRALLKKTKKGDLLYGESVIVFDSSHTVNAFIDDLSFGNVPNHLRIHRQPQDVFLLLQVKGPGSTNPSSRLKMAKIYISVEVLIKKSLLWLPYLEIPLRQIQIIAGDKNLRIEES